MIYLPYKTLMSNTEVLDDITLCSQILHIRKVLAICETKRSRDGLFTGTIADADSPLVLMWEPNVKFLKNYYELTNIECVKRGLTDNASKYRMSACNLPNWLGFPELHYSHRIQLLGINHDHYRPNPGFSADFSSTEWYFWPTTKRNKRKINEWLSKRRK